MDDAGFVKLFRRAGLKLASDQDSLQVTPTPEWSACSCDQQSPLAKPVGGNRAIVGQTIHANTDPFTIVGVAPAKFQGSTSGLRFDLWLPVTATAALGDDRGDLLKNRNNSWLILIGRLRPVPAASKRKPN